MMGRLGCLTILIVLFSVTGMPTNAQQPADEGARAVQQPQNAAGARSSGDAQAAYNVTRARINRGTVTIISGGVNGTYIRIASDLAAVLDRSDDLRILPVLGKGSVQNITDILYLRGVDIGIVQSDVLTYIRNRRLHPTIQQRINYITKLYNEELHILVGPGIDSIADLAGRKVNFGVEGSGTFITVSTAFDLLGADVEPTDFDQALALEKLRNGEIAGLAYVAGKPTTLFASLDRTGGLHFLPIQPTAELLEIYLPSELTHADYPGLVPEDEAVPTVAVGAVMAVYNWQRGSERHRKVERFVNAFFDNFEQFLQAPRHRKWQEVNLATDVPGWTRFAPAQRWLEENPIGAEMAGNAELRATFERFLSFLAEDTGSVEQMNAAERRRLFARFLEWQDQENAR